METGFLPIGTPALDLALARKNADKSQSLLEKVGASVVRPVQLATQADEIAGCVRAFKQADIGLLVIQVGTWCPDTLALSAAKELDVPILLWAVPERPRGGFPDGGMLVGLTQVGGTLSKFGKNPKIVFGEPEEPDVEGRVQGFLRVAETKRTLQRARVGLVGHGCPGMSDTSFHEMELQRVIGPEVVHLDLSTLRLHVEEAAPTDGDVGQVRTLGRPEGVGEEDLVAAAKMLLGLRAMVREHGLSAVAVKCWPELKELGIPSPCYGLSMLSEEGVAAACEGDLTGAVSMMTLDHLAGQPAYLGDFMAMDKERNVAYAFHCGAAAPSLADSAAGIEIRLHAEKGITWKRGITVEFPVKPGQVTFCRIGEVQAQYRMLVFGGQAIESDMFVRGNTAKVALDTPIMQVLEHTVALGCEHHYIMVHSDLREHLLDLAGELGIQATAI